MLSKWRRNFTAKDFKLVDDEPEKFVTCQWQKDTDPRIWYLVYRWILAIYFFVTWLLSILIVKKDTIDFKLKWLIYLTNWGYTTCTYQAILVAIMLSVCFLSHRTGSFTKLKDRTLSIHAVYWVMNTIATVVAYGITIIYWSFIFDKKKNVLDAMNLMLHVLNTVFMMIDFWMVSHPVRFAHFIYPVGFVAIYGFFSAIYYLAGGTSREDTDYIYPILKWSLPFKTLIVCLCVGLFFFVIHCFLYMLYQLKKSVNKKLHRRRSIELAPTTGYTNEAYGGVLDL